MSPRKESRFAVVLNGGVSLAVWMGGVTHELNRLRIASAQDDPRVSRCERPEDPAEAAVHDAWRAILDSASRSAVVDTVAGTSAGGLNGTLLAASLAGGKDLSGMKKTWLDVPALERGKLLSAAGEPPNALLDGDFFRREVEALLRGLVDGDTVVDPQECTLLVTATAIDAVPLEIELEGAASAHMMDSRRVYKFERRSRITGDDRDGPLEVHDDFLAAPSTIALAARASASFPVAFAPVRETPELRRFRMPSAPAPESLPGADRTVPAGERSDGPAGEWLIDGGVLDNAPFGPLMDVLRARPVGAPFERVVLYITPSPGVQGRVRDLGTRPRATRVLQRVMAAFREPDQRLDFEGLRDAFTVMSYTHSTPHDAVLALFRSGNARELSSAIRTTVRNPEWFHTYRASRAEAVERQLAALGAGIRFSAPESPVLRPDEVRSVPTDPEYTGDEWRWGVAAAVRALRWWGRALVAYYYDDPAHPGVSRDALDEALEQVRRSQQWLAQLDLRLGSALMRQFAAAPVGGLTRADLLERAECLRLGLQGMEHSIQVAVEAAATAIVGSVPQLAGMDGEALVNVTLAVEVASTVLSWGGSSEGDEPAFRYHQITPAAEGLVAVDERVTDHQGWPARKLYGERLGHFGAFLQRKNREADWLWGRLDGASALCEHLLRDVDEAEARELERELAARILVAEDSSGSLLNDAARRAVRTGSWGLLRKIDPRSVLGGVRFLWDKTRVVVASGRRG